MSEFAPNSTRASFEVARVALGRMLGEPPAANAPRTLPVTMAVRANDAWKAVEQVLRAVTGRSELAGQALLTEARRVDALDMDGTHALVALREWVERTLAPGSAAQMLTLAPTEAEKEVARNAVSALERSVGVAPSNTDIPTSDTTAARDTSRFSAPATSSASSMPASEWAPPQAGATTPRPTGAQPDFRPQAATSSSNPAAKDMLSARMAGDETVATLEPARPTSRSSTWIMAAIALVIILAGGGAWYALKGGAGTSSDETEQGIAAYGRGSKEAARLSLVKAVEKNPNDVRALIYLGRISRDLGNLATARKYLEDAIRIEPKNATALREFASALLADQQPELARRFYVRALEAKPDDRVAQGFLGCALMRLNRNDEAQRWFARAGTGEWSACNAAPVQAPVAKD